MTLPKDPFILYSFVNTQLRDFYPDIEQFCDASNIPVSELKEKLATIGFEYVEEINQFK